MVRLGQRLKDARIQRNKTLEEVAVALKIKPQFLAAIEEGDYNELPSPAYARGFVKNYAEYLGFSKVQTSALFKRDFDEKRAMKVLPEGMTTSRDFPLKRTNLRRAIIGVVTFLILLGFLLFQTRDLFIPPLIQIKSPKDGGIVSRQAEVMGKTDRNAIVTVNNEPVFVQDNGEFVKKVTLFPGKTSIIVTAKNRSGRETSQTVSLTVR